MAQSISHVILHIIFSTKNREPIIPAHVEPELYPYLASACKAHGSHAYRVGGMSDHIHIACTLSRTLTISKLVEELKTSSSKWMKTKGVGRFSWQGGYGAFSIGKSQLDGLIVYIEGQKEHHREKTFKEEYLALLKKYEIAFDERYLWE